jgi:hypothetical protein
MYSFVMPKEPKTGRMSARLTTTCRALMDGISAKLGISDAAVIEIAVREYAERHNVKPLYQPESKEEG